ncbi:MAG: hypothetical protein U0350_12055 [Caldilineaceae bacterium]
MTTMVVPTEQTNLQTKKSQPKFRIAVHIDTEVLDPEVARRKANVWLLLYAGHLLRADFPELILEKELMWRYAVVLTSPQGGDVGRIGQIHVQATTGEVVVSESLSSELLANAKLLIAQRAIQSNENNNPQHLTAEMIVNAPSFATH